MTLEERVLHLEQLMREVHPHWWLKIDSWQGASGTFYYKECVCGERCTITFKEYQALKQLIPNKED